MNEQAIVAKYENGILSLAIPEKNQKRIKIKKSL
ncbi:MAG: hypothetical protein H7282_00565 [Cytophagaceae bacterium]|nr:hypothetical protein [Cytophagaceae bacterium]